MTLLVYGNPTDGFTFIGPITPNDPNLEAWIDKNLRNESWWYLDVEQPEWETGPEDAEPATVAPCAWIAFHSDWSGFALFFDELEAYKYAMDHNMSGVRPFHNGDSRDSG